MFMYMKLDLQRRISACRTAVPRTLSRYRCMRLPVHCDCTAARLPCVFTLLKIQASIHVHVHELYSAEYPCMVKVCAPGQRRVYMYITKMTRTRANFTSLVCTAFLLSVVCYAAQERQKASCSGSPQNALHCLVILLWISFPLPPHDRRDRPASSPTPPIAAGANTPVSVSNSSIVLAAATDAAIPPPSNDVRLPNPAPPKFSDDRPLDWLYGINDGNNSIIWMDGDCVSLSRSSGLQSASEEKPEPTFSSPPDSSIVPSPNVTDFWSSATIGITWFFRQLLFLFSSCFHHLIFPSLIFGLSFCCRECHVQSWA